MNAKEAIEKAKESFYLLDSFRETININDKKLLVKSLIDIITTVKENGSKMEEIFSNMKIFVENEARFSLCAIEEEKKSKFELQKANRRLNRLKDLDDSLEARIKTIKDVKKEFKEYLLCMEAYLSILSRLKKEGKKNIPKDVRNDFEKVQTNIIGILNILCSLKVLKDFESLSSVSYQNLEAEIKIDEMYIRYHDEKKFKWLNVKEN